MTTNTWLLNGFLALALIATGCGDDVGGTGGSAGMGGSAGSAGTGGSGGSAGTGGSVVPEGVQLTYEGDPLVLADTANVCNVLTDGDVTEMTAGVQTREGEPNQVTLFFLMDEGDSFSGRTVFDSLATGSGSVSDVPMLLNGQLDLVDFDDDIVQQLRLGTCSVDFSFIATIELFPGTNGNKYMLSFDCATVPYNFLNIMTSMVGEMGTLTDLSGQFECILNAVEE